jgi:hypothetical protein
MWHVAPALMRNDCGAVPEPLDAVPLQVFALLLLALAAAASQSLGSVIDTSAPLGSASLHAVGFAPLYNVSVGATPMVDSIASSRALFTVVL